jgi:hypothetical protein
MFRCACGQPLAGKGGGSGAMDHRGGEKKPEHSTHLNKSHNPGQMLNVEM